MLQGQRPPPTAVVVHKPPAARGKQNAEGQNWLSIAIVAVAAALAVTTISLAHRGRGRRRPLRRRAGPQDDRADTTREAGGARAR